MRLLRLAITLMFDWRQLLPGWLCELLARFLSSDSQLEQDADGVIMPNSLTPYRILVASYTDAIVTLEFTPPTAEEKASLKAVSRLVVGHHPSWVARHPVDDSLVFTGLEQSDGRLLAIKFNRASGEGKVVADVSSGGHDPCTIAVTKDSVLVGNVSCRIFFHGRES